VATGGQVSFSFVTRPRFRFAGAGESKKQPVQLSTEDAAGAGTPAASTSLTAGPNPPLTTRSQI
jgi:hypothetical protein